jgi:hypothetical protein
MIQDCEHSLATALDEASLNLIMREFANQKAPARLCSWSAGKLPFPRIVCSQVAIAKLAAAALRPAMLFPKAILEAKWAADAPFSRGDGYQA